MKKRDLMNLAMVALAFSFYSCASLNVAKNDETSSRSPASTVPAGPGHGVQRTSRVQTPTEKVGSCGASEIARLDMGNGFTAQDVLLRIEQYGTFSGAINVPTWRQIPLAGNYYQWTVDYATNVSRDAENLAKWFEGSAPGVSASAIEELALDSDAYKYAVNFVSGEGAHKVYRGQADIGHRSAAILAVMFAAAEAGNPDCVTFLQRTWVTRLIPNDKARGFLGKLELKRAADLAKEGRLDDVFNQMHGNRADIANQIEMARQELKFAEERNEWEMKQIQFEMQTAYQDLTAVLADIPGCRDAVSLHNTLFASSNSPMSHAQQAISKCRNKVFSKLSEARMAQLKEQGRIRVYEGRMEFEKERMERALERNEDADTSSYEERIAKYEEKIEEIKEKNEETVARVEKFEDALEAVSNPETSSYSAELDRIRELMQDKTERSSDAYFAPQRQALKRLEDDLSVNNNQYLTLGYMGGFE